MPGVAGQPVDFLVRGRVLVPSARLGVVCVSTDLDLDVLALFALGAVGDIKTTF